MCTTTKRSITSIKMWISLLTPINVSISLLTQRSHYQATRWCESWKKTFQLPLAYHRMSPSLPATEGRHGSWTCSKDLRDLLTCFSASSKIADFLGWHSQPLDHLSVWLLNANSKANSKFFQSRVSDENTIGFLTGVHRYVFFLYRGLQG